MRDSLVPLLLLGRLRNRRLLVCPDKADLFLDLLLLNRHRSALDFLHGFSGEDVTSRLGLAESERRCLWVLWWGDVGILSEFVFDYDRRAATGFAADGGDGDAGLLWRCNYVTTV
ncbi:hypothetical protein PLICRDRAFT_239266 [Plicaturopsis crispa FD-325 SS-3]|nr:hypothetical protein PLICRDRAFT_239266 [Plicaturopsis crispa FD-325 SS-3]